MANPADEDGSGRAQVDCAGGRFHRGDHDHDHDPKASASRKDALVGNGVVDPTGASGSFIGHLLETSVLVGLLPGNLALEVGGARVFAGEFLTAQNVDDATYAYLQTTVTF